MSQIAQFDLPEEVSYTCYACGCTGFHPANRLSSHLNLSIVTPADRYKDSMHVWDLCPTCAGKLSSRLSDFIRGWQPIETAPKEGQHMLMTDGCIVTAAFWLPNRNHHDGGTWEVVGADDTWSFRPTHWQSLPPLPEET